MQAVREIKTLTALMILGRSYETGFVTVKNIESTERQLLDMLASLPFQIVAKQYEMVYCINEDRG